MIAVYILVGIVAIGINIYISLLFREAAEDKGYDGAKYFWACFLFGIAGYLLVVALPNLQCAPTSSTSNFPNPSQSSSLSKQTTYPNKVKTCVNCGKTQAVLSEKCIECGGVI